MKTKKTAYLFLLAILMASCVSVKEIGKVNMISNRNIDPNLKYQLITTYSGGSNHEFKKSTAKTIEDAIDETVKKIPGGEFLMNAKIYSVNGQYFAVEGDVWGEINNQSYRGFKVGDKVTWKKLGDFYIGAIYALKDDKTCYVSTSIGNDGKNEIVELSYDDITKTTNTSPTKTDSTPTFKIGDKVLFENAFGSFIEGKIIAINNNSAIIEFTNASKNIKKREIPFSRITKEK